MPPEPAGLAAALSAVVARQGNAQERQVLSRWQRELERFMAPFEVAINAGHLACSLTVGARLALGVTVRGIRVDPSSLWPTESSLPGPAALLLQTARDQGVSSRITLRMSSSECQTTVLAKDTHGLIAPLLVASGAISSTPPGIPANAWLAHGTAVGAIHTSRKSAELEARRMRYCTDLENVLHCPLSRHVHELWTLRFDQAGQWQETRAGMTFIPAPLSLVSALVNQRGHHQFACLCQRVAYRRLSMSGPPGEPADEWEFQRF